MKSSSVVSRIAPTPSGYLHMGNAVNFVLTAAYVRHFGGELILRIDDMDATRCRREFVDDIFYTLEWLGIDIDRGPSGTETFYRDYSMLDRMDYYRSELEKLSHSGALLYACECSRKQIEVASHDGRYPQSCLTRELALTAHKSAMRIHVPDATDIRIDGNNLISLDQSLGDFVLWRKDDLAAYQFVSVIEDRDLGVNAIIRGEDLLESTAAQLFLARYLNAPIFLNARFIHHPLLLQSDGKKLSKSEGALAVKSLRHEGERGKAKVLAEARRFLPYLGIETL